MLKIIHLTDTHLVGQGTRLYGLDPHHRLKRAIADINANHGDAHSVVITGDLTNWGEPAEYQALSDALSGLEVPVTLVMGNHDQRGNFRAAFPDGLADENGFVQAAIKTDEGTLVVLDTLQEGTHGGWLCEDRIAWLEKTLAESEGPVFIFMHHPPFDVMLPDMDQYGLIHRDEFEAAITPHKDRIRQIFFGHVHRPIHGEWLGIPFSTLRGTNHQVWLDLDGRDDGDMAMSYEAPAYGIVLINDRITLIHEHDFTYRDKIYLCTAPEDVSDYEFSTTHFEHHD